jgi:RND family efflux transporter MFP subunit
MKKKLPGLLGLILLVPLIAGLAWYSLFGRKEEPQHMTTPGPALIQVASPHRRDFPVLSPFFGTVESSASVSLVVLEPGRIVSVNAPDEAPVKKGALLFTLGGPRVRVRSKTLEARIASLREQVDLAGRAVALKQEALAQKMAKKEEFLSAKDALSRLRSDLTDAEREFSSFRARLEERAPFDGVVTGRRVSPGQDVEKGDLLAELIPPKSLRIVADLFPPEDVPLIGLEAEVETGTGGALTATVTKVRPVRTPEGATVVWLEGDTMNRNLAPGESVPGHVLISLHKGALAVPLSAVVRDKQEQTFVFLKTPAGYRKQAVKTGEISNGWVEVTQGIKETDGVVIRGAYELFFRDFNKTYKVAD